MPGLCIYIYIYIYRYVYVYVYIYIYIYIHTHIKHTCIRVVLLERRRTHIWEATGTLEVDPVIPWMRKDGIRGCTFGMGIYQRGVQSEGGMQWMGVVFYNKTAYNMI